LSRAEICAIVFPFPEQNPRLAKPLAEERSERGTREERLRHFAQSLRQGRIFYLESS
jgi:hypothetical protein